MTRQRTLRWQALVVAAIATYACDKISAPAAPENANNAAGGAVEDLTIVVQADRSRILQEETALQSKRKDFESERNRLDQQRAEVAGKLASLSKKDKSQRDQLEAANRQLAEEQRRVRERADSFESDRVKLDDDKNKLLERIAKMTQTKGGLSIEQREEAIAHRERDVAQREHDVARREAEASHGLADVSKMVDELRGGIQATKSAAASQAAAAAAAAAAASSSSSTGGSIVIGPANKLSVQRALKQVHGLMANKGILLDDLPPSVRDLDTNASNAANARDYGAAAEALNLLNQAVESISVNYGFVQAKMARINRQTAEKKAGNLDETRQKKIQGLLAEASDSFSDGRYDRANKKINQIYALLQNS